MACSRTLRWMPRDFCERLRSNGIGGLRGFEAAVRLLCYWPLGSVDARFREAIKALNSGRVPLQTLCDRWQSQFIDAAVSGPCGRKSG